jgi:hypothetical protein
MKAMRIATGEALDLFLLLGGTLPENEGETSRYESKYPLRLF